MLDPVQLWEFENGLLPGDRSVQSQNSLKVIAVTVLARENQSLGCREGNGRLYVKALQFDFSRAVELSRIHTSPFSVAIFVWQFLFAHLYDKICPAFKWQIHLLKNLLASFYVTNKKCHMW